MWSRLRRGFQWPARRSSAASFLPTPGGKGANQAYAAAKLAGSVAMVGRVGDDEFGRQMRENLASVGCAIDGVRTVPGASGVALICVSESGENCIVVVPGANHSLRPADVGDVFDGCAVALLQLETPIETVIAAARFAKQRNARVILDPAPAPASGLPRELLESVDILTPNETEAAILADSLDGQWPRTIILKLGERGCELRQRRQVDLYSRCSRECGRYDGGWRCVQRRAGGRFERRRGTRGCVPLRGESGGCFGDPIRSPEQRTVAQ